jgi:hypothetical protein
MAGVNPGKYSFGKTVKVSYDEAVGRATEALARLEQRHRRIL